jgi:hypothetical protein
MCFLVYVFKTTDGKMRIDLWCGKACMTKQFLHYPYIAARIHQMCRKAVPEAVGMYILSQPGTFSILRDDPAHSRY